MRDTEASPTDAPACTVYYDGASPLCRAEIALYQRIGARARFLDLSTEAALPPGVTREAALARFHVATADGAVLSGARAFAALWRTAPGGWRVLGRVVAARPFVWLAEGLYRVSLVVRPWLERAARARRG